MAKKSKPDQDSGTWLHLRISRADENDKRQIEATVEGRELPMMGMPEFAADGEDVRNYVKLDHAVNFIRGAISPYLEKFLDGYVDYYLSRTDTDTVESKRKLARSLNSFIDKYSYAIMHPESRDPCLLLVVNDKWGGKFVLENRNTRKRSHTTSDIRKLLPIKLVGYHEW